MYYKSDYFVEMIMINVVIVCVIVFEIIGCIQ